DHLARVSARAQDGDQRGQGVPPEPARPQHGAQDEARDDEPDRQRHHREVAGVVAARGGPGGRARGDVVAVAHRVGQLLARDYSPETTMSAYPSDCLASQARMNGHTTTAFSPRARMSSSANRASALP